MRFYAESISHELLFSTNDIIQAVFTAWNFHADLWLVADNTKYSDLKKFATLEKKLLFSSASPFACDLSEYNIKLVEPNDIFPNCWDFEIESLKNGKRYYFDTTKIKELKEKKI